MSTNQDNGRIVVSPELVNGEKFGVYLVPDENSKVEYRLRGGYESAEEARTHARGLLDQMLQPGSGVSDVDEEVSSRDRPEVEIDSADRILDEDDLKKAVQSHVDRQIAKVSRVKFVASLLSYENLLAYVSVLAAWLFWKDTTFTIPGGLDLPIIGERLSGRTLTAEIMARYLPLVYFVLYLGVILRVRRTSLEFDLLRREILALVLLHGWRALDFIKLLRRQMVISSAAWFGNALEGLYKRHPASLSGLKKTAWAAEANSPAHAPSPTTKEPAAGNDATGDLQAELIRKLEHWIPDEFEGRIHNLYFLGRERDYSEYFVPFDPLSYIISTNRALFKAYSFLRQEGAPVDVLNAPKDPYLMERMMIPIFWITSALRTVMTAGVLTWSFLLSGVSVTVMTAASMGAAAFVLLYPIWWNHRVLVRRNGFPKMELLGAYLIGPVAPNRLLTL